MGIIPSPPGKPTFGPYIPPSSGLLYESNLVYKGAFRVPLLNQTLGWNYGGTALTYNPHNNSLLAVGHDQNQWIGEFSIVVPKAGVPITSLNTSALIKTPTDWLQGRRNTVDGTISNGTKIGGILVLGPNKFVISVWTYYDTSPNPQTKTHFLLDNGVLTGPFQVGNGFNEYAPDHTRIGGFVSGYMCTIPSNWKSQFGYSYLTGQGGYISIVGRTSSGPSGNGFNDLTPTAAKLMMGYPMGDPLDHPTLGRWGVHGSGLGLYDGTQGFRGVVFPEGFDSIIYYGWGGTTFCYGAGTADPNLAGKPVPGQPGQIYCYDPTGGTGTHGYPYQNLAFAYDVKDFIAVKNGTKKPWEVVPYATWKFSVPFARNRWEIFGSAYNPNTKEIYLSSYRADLDRPLIHVFGIQ